MGRDLPPGPFTYMATFIAIMNGLAAIPKIGDQIMTLAGWFTAWYINNVRGEQASKIVDTVAFNVHAQTQEDRLKALDMWKEVISQKRVIP